LCGTCRCHFDSGREYADAVKPKERRHLSEAAIEAGYRMACQTFVSGDVSISWEAK
jgi:ferredoxin